MVKQYKYNTSALDRTVVVMDLDLNILEIQNPESTFLKGVNEINLEGQPVTRLLELYDKATQHNNLVMEKLYNTQKTGKQCYFEYNFEEDGKKYYAHGHTRKDKKEFISCSLTYVEEKDLIRPREQYFFEQLNHAIDHINAGVFVVHGKMNDRDDVSIYSNKQYKEMFDCPSGDPRDSKKWDHSICYSHDNILLNERMDCVGYELVTTNDDGTQDRIFDVHKQLYTPTEDSFTIVTTVTDITDLRNKISALDIAKKKAEAADKMRSAFLQNITHEIRTPLNSIQGFSQLLCENSLSDAEKQELFGYIKDNTDSLVNLLNNLIDLSTFDAGITDIDTNWFDIHDLCNEIYFSISLKHQKISDKVTFKYKVPEELKGYSVNSNRKRVMQVLRNFCTNAVKYTNEGYIEMSYGFRDGGLYVYVKDTGIGITEENRKKVFNRFEKFGSYKPGAGIGLTICKAICKAMGGDIGCQPNTPQGSIFYAWFPCEVRKDK